MTKTSTKTVDQNEWIKLSIVGFWRLIWTFLIQHNIFRAKLPLKKIPKNVQLIVAFIKSLTKKCWNLSQLVDPQSYTRYYITQLAFFYPWLDLLIHIISNNVLKLSEYSIKMKLAKNCQKKLHKRLKFTHNIDHLLFSFLIYIYNDAKYIKLTIKLSLKDTKIIIFVFLCFKIISP